MNLPHLLLSTFVVGALGALWCAERKKRRRAEELDIKRQQQCTRSLQEGQEVQEVLLRLPSLRFVAEQLGTEALTDLDEDVRLLLLGELTVPEFQRQLELLLNQTEETKL